MEQYRSLEEHYNELEYQYGEAMNELHKAQEQLPEGELDSYKEKISALHNENV